MVRGPGAPRRVLGRSAALVAAISAVIAITLPTVAASADPSGSVTPNRDLQTDQRVHVHAEGLPARTVIVVLECTQAARSAADCEGQSADVSAQTDAKGVYDNPAYQVLTQPNQHFQSASIRCDKTHPCVLYVGVDYNDFRQPKIFLPISFSGAAGLPAPSARVSKPSRSRGTRSVLVPAVLVVIIAVAVIGLRSRRGP